MNLLGLTEIKKNMSFMFHTKYRVVIFTKDINVINNISSTLKRWFNNKVSLEVYDDAHAMFMALNIAKAKNCPFRMAIMGPDQNVEAQLVLQHTDPNIKVVNYKDDSTLNNIRFDFTYK